MNDNTVTAILFICLAAVAITIAVCLTFHHSQENRLCIEAGMEQVHIDGSGWYWQFPRRAAEAKP